MPRKLDKISKDDLLVELEEKHNVTTSLKRTRKVELPIPDDAPEDAEPISEDQPLPVEKMNKDEILEEFGYLLDTTTEEEREEAAKEAAKRENEQAERAAYEFAQRQERTQRRELVKATAIALRDLPSEQRVDAAKRLHGDDRISSEQLEEVIEELTDGDPDA